MVRSSRLKLIASVFALPARFLSPTVTLWCLAQWSLAKNRWCKISSRSRSITKKNSMPLAKSLALSLLSVKENQPTRLFWSVVWSIARFVHSSRKAIVKKFRWSLLYFRWIQISVQIWLLWWLLLLLFWMLACLSTDRLPVYVSVVWMVNLRPSSVQKSVKLPILILWSLWKMIRWWWWKRVRTKFPNLSLSMLCVGPLKWCSQLSNFKKPWRPN